MCPFLCYGWYWTRCGRVNQISPTTSTHAFLSFPALHAWFLSKLMRLTYLFRPNSVCVSPVYNFFPLIFCRSSFSAVHFKTYMCLVFGIFSDLHLQVCVYAQCVGRALKMCFSCSFSAVPILHRYYPARWYPSAYVCVCVWCYVCVYICLCVRGEPT